VLITENQLDDWVRGNAKLAQGVIVELVWRLVAAAVPRPKERRFPLGDSIGQHGPDGVLHVDLGLDPFVPDGRSFWEIGTGLDAASKATADYKELTEATPDQVKAGSTFVFVSPLSGRRGWEGSWKESAQLDWKSRRQHERKWQDVRVIDGTVLIDWIRKFPSVELWLAQQMSGVPTNEIETVEQRWATTRSIGEPPALTNHIFLANRDEACAKLNDLIGDKISQLKLETFYPDQIADFVAAYVLGLPSEIQVDATSRCLIVSGAVAWDALSKYSEKHILIAESPLDLNSDLGMRLIQKARRAGHSVIFGGPQGGIPDPTSAVLASPKIQQIKEGLEQAGYNAERARSIAQRSGGNLGFVLRCLQNLSLMPQWAEDSTAAELAIAMALGSWDERSDADRQAAENILGKPYGEWIATIRKVAHRPGTPLKVWETEWRFSARYEGWNALGRLLSDDQVEKISETAIEILSENDPQFNLPVKDRYMARARGKVMVHSHSLRLGIAEFLALLGSYPDALTGCSTNKVASCAAQAIHSIFHEADWQRWASLDRLLPLLSEAAPNAFLAAVEAGLDAEPCPFDVLFAQESDDILGGGTLMSGVLWALETLAWNASLLARASECLAKLALRDPGGRWSNRPANSLRTIFLPWQPQTCAAIPARIAIISRIIKEIPEVGWKLVLTLLPERHSVSIGSRRPAWRPWIPQDWKREVLEKDYWDQVSAYATLLIEAASHKVERLIEMIGRIEDLPSEMQTRFFDNLETSADLADGGESRYAIWLKLESYLAKHERFSTSDWAMPAQKRQRIAELSKKIAPKDPVIYLRRLFDENDFDLYPSTDNFEKQQLVLEERRKLATQEIFTIGGVGLVLEFAIKSKSPSRVGLAFGSLGINADNEIFPTHIRERGNALFNFASGYLWARFANLGWDWVDLRNFDKWSHSEIANFFSLLPFKAETWRRASSILGELEDEFWKVASVSVFNAEEESDEAIAKLIKYGRPKVAITCLHQKLYLKMPVDSDLVVAALLGTIKSSEPDGPIDDYAAIELIKLLQQDPTVAAAKLVQIEWAYLPLLDINQGVYARTIEEEMASNPSSFCGVLRMVFHGVNNDSPEELITEEKSIVAANAYRLLSAWRIPPGLQSDGCLDGGKLISWLDAMVEESRSTGHLEIALEMFGRVLTHAPGDPTGLWIHRDAASILDAAKNEAIRDGFRIQLYNARGVHWVDPTGKPERELANDYRKKADDVEYAGFFRLATTLRDLAENYDHEAEKNISRALRED